MPVVDKSLGLKFTKAPVKVFLLSILFELSSKQPAFFEKSCIYRRDDDGGLGVGALGRVRVGGAGVWIFAPLRLANHQIPAPTIAIVIIRDKIKTGALSF